ncbi:MAG: cytochrome bd ubiquinol oxidase subunit, partial [Actinomycetota bacterium]|nr:cytochrome bd ubiquinol oxidase subunit [Actinomycetota bacterium]
VLRADAPALFDELTHGRGLVLAVFSAASGVVSLGLLAARRYVAVRVSAALAVAGVLWAWGAAQYPTLLPPDATVADVRAGQAVLDATLLVLAVGAVVVVPSLGWLYVLFQREHERTATPG